MDLKEAINVLKKTIMELQAIDHVYKQKAEFKIETTIIVTLKT